MDNYPQLKAAVLGALAPGNGAPAPTMGSSLGPELQRFYDINFQLPQSTAGVKAIAANDAVTQNNAHEDLKNQIATLSDQAKRVDPTNPNNYQKVRKQDGGFQFLDPNGKEISAVQYADAVGKTPQEILSDSRNPIDNQYVQDFHDLQDYIKAKMTGDTTTSAAVEDYVRKNYGIDLSKQNPSQLLQTFTQQYPTVYGNTQNGVTKTGRTFIPALSVANNASTGTIGQ